MKLLLAYLAISIDVVPDSLPVVGYADDAVGTALVRRSVVRRRVRRRAPAEVCRHVRRPVPSGRAGVQPGGGHHPWLDDPEWFVQTLATFLP